MPEGTKTVRHVDADVYRLFRAKTVEFGYSTGDALTEALRLWINAKSRPRIALRAGVDSPVTPHDAALVEGS